MLRDEIIFHQIVVQIFEDDTLKDFIKDGKERYWPVITDGLFVLLLVDRRDIGHFPLRRVNPRGEDVSEDEKEGCGYSIATQFDHVHRYVIMTMSLADLQQLDQIPYFLN